MYEVQFLTTVVTVILQEALQMQRVRTMRHKHEISHLKRLAIGNNLQGYSRS